LTFFFWRAESLDYVLSNQAKPVCWPFLENCFVHRNFSLHQVDTVLLAFGFLAGVGVLLFLPRRWVKAAYFFQVGMLIFKLLIFIWDFRMRMNQHYMLHFVILTYLFIPHKRANLQYLLVFFYVGAAFLKMNREWVTGAVFNPDYQPLFIPGNWIPAACVYVIILELIIIWGMLSREKWIFWGTFFQLGLFHVVSWPVVGFFYPLLMISLLMIYPLAYFMPRGGEDSRLFAALFLFRQPFSTYVLGAFFFFLQFVPGFFPGDSRLTAEGRLFSLHMYDARPVCQGALTLKYHDGTKEDLDIPALAKPRIRCDPLVYFSRAQWQCWKNRGDPRFDNLDYVMEARLTTERNMRPLVDIKDFCGKDLHYHIFRSNEWIIK